jgi:low affinity Fe/Cu permease
MPLQPDSDVRGLSRVFHAVDSATSRPNTVAVVVLLVTVTLIGVVATGFSNSLQLAFTTLAAAVTLVMVFVIQHTQSRHQLTLQIKLDELLRALPQADDRFVHVEGGSDEELHELESRHVETHAAVRADEL